MERAWWPASTVELANGLKKHELSDFSMLFLKRAENYCSLNFEDDEVTSEVKRRLVLGRAAMQFLFDRMRQQQAQEPSILRLLRSFRWMMGAEQEAQYETWQRESVQNARDII